MNVATPLTELIHAVLDGEASDSEARELERRLAADPLARAEFDKWQGLFQALRELPQEYAPEGLVAAVSAALPAEPARSAALRQPFASRRVLGYTSSRIPPASRLGDAPATQRPTSTTRSVLMSQQSSRFFATRKGWLGAGIAAAAAVVVAQLAFDFPVAKDVMGTVAPAQRYRAAPNGSEDVKLAPAATPGAAIGTAPEANRAVAERTEAQKMSERSTDAQRMAERTKADRTAERSTAEMTAQRTEANRLEAQRSMEKSTNRVAP